MKEYITVAGTSSAEYIEKKSRFIATVSFCENESSAAILIDEVKRKYWDARHNVYAYILSDGTARFSDDGEPHGTAAKPVLDVIKGSGAVNVIVTVTRYFGGTLLGTGGLVRAYSTAARDAFSSAILVRMCPCKIYLLSCDYSNHARLSSILQSSNAKIVNTEFADNVTVTAAVESKSSENFEELIKENFSSKISPKFIKEEFFALNCEKKEEF